MKPLIVMLAFLLIFCAGLGIGAWITERAYVYPTRGQGYKTTQKTDEKYSERLRSLKGE